jgi:hypothetical protein
VLPSHSVALSDRQRPHDSAQWEQTECPLRLVRTPCHYGGRKNMVPVSCPRLWPTRRHSLRGLYIRVSSLLSSCVPEPAGTELSESSEPHSSHSGRGNFLLEPLMDFTLLVRPFEPGQTIGDGRFEILREIGGGGCSGRRLFLQPVHLELSCRHCPGTLLLNGLKFVGIQSKCFQNRRCDLHGLHRSVDHAGAETGLLTRWGFYDSNPAIRGRKGNNGARHRCR